MADTKKELADVLKSVAQFVNAMGLALEDKKFDLGDLAFFVPALITLPEAVENASKIRPAVLSDAEMKELQKILAEQLNLPQDKIETYIEASFNVLTNIFILVKDYYRFLKDAKL